MALGDGVKGEHDEHRQWVERLAPRIVVPHHDHTWNVVQRQSTLLPVEQWLSTQPRGRRLDSAEATYAPETLPGEVTVDHFGDYVAFDVEAWHAENGMKVG